MKKSSKINILSMAAFALINLLSISLLLISRFVFNANAAFDTTVFNYAEIFINRFIEFALVPIAATIIYIGGANGTKKSAIVRAILFSLPRTIYLIPYYYCYYRAELYDTAESLVLSSIVTFFGVLLMFVQILIFHAVFIVATGIIIKRQLIRDLPPACRNDMPKNLNELINEKTKENLKFIPENRGVFDFNIPVTVGIFATVFLQFVISLLSEISTTASFLVSSSGNYGVDDIIYMTFSYVFILLELLSVHIICYSLKNLITKSQSEDVKDERKL